jgi:dTDP-4-dehydrorhamnose 3,5-epimerase
MQAERLTCSGGAVLHGPLLLTPRVFDDARGWFIESWNAHTFAKLLAADGQHPAPGFVQDNHSCSSRGVLRGLHYQLPHCAQGKLVRCVAGAIVDVAVDIRQSSATFGQWGSAELSAANRQHLWIPAGFAHGFLSLEAGSEVLYKSTYIWAPAFERGLLWNDPQLAIDWGLPLLGLAEPLLAAKDAAAPLLTEALAAGEVFR